MRRAAFFLPTLCGPLGRSNCRGFLIMPPLMLAIWFGLLGTAELLILLPDRADGYFHYR